MKTLKKFECKNAKIIVRMHNVKKENVTALYSVQETPKSKNAKWHEETKYFTYYKEANEHFVNLIMFWCTYKK